MGHVNRLIAFGRTTIRSAFGDRGGSVSTVFALSLVPMIGIIGIGADFSRTFMVKTALDASADAAALAAVTEAEATLQSPYGIGASGLATAEYAGQLAGQKMFLVDATRASSQIVGGTPTPTVTVSETTPNVLTARVTYSGRVSTTFGSLFGLKQTSISGVSASSLTLPKWMNISVVIDNSQSMGLAATDAGMAQLQGLTPDNCAFGCHVQAAAQAGSQYTTPYEQIAENAGIQLRIDVIRTGTVNMIQSAQNIQAGGTPLISFSLFTLDGTLNPLAQNSTAYPALLSTAESLDLDATTTAPGIGDSDDTDAMTALTTAVSTSGTGASASQPQQFVFLMTDGVQDVYCAGGYGSHCTQAFNPALCSALKAKGVTVGVIYTTYLQMNSDPRYLALVASFDNQIAPNLQQCASPGWFYQAANATDIQAAINALFNQATGHGVLTQ